MEHMQQDKMYICGKMLMDHSIMYQLLVQMELRVDILVTLLVKMV